MIDRENRNLLIVAIEKYLNEETTSFSFDDEIFDISHKTLEGSIPRIVDLLWYHYDDCKDHKAVLSKEQWDFFQRLLLFLKSEAQFIKVQKGRHWSFTQIIALLSFLGFICCAYQMGFSYGPLLFITIPFVMVSLLILRLHRGDVSEMTPIEMKIFPFESISQLLFIRRSVKNFEKRPYPQKLEMRTIRSVLSETFLKIQSGLVLFALLPFLSPLLLFFQMLPTTKSETRIFIEEKQVDARL